MRFGSDGHGVASGEGEVPHDAVPVGKVAGGQEDPREPVAGETQAQCGLAENCCFEEVKIHTKNAVHCFATH